MHQFVYDNDFYAPKEFELNDTINSDKVKLKTLLFEEKSHLKYEYDFGDGWVHKVLLEKIIPYEKGLILSRCIAGKGNCPPEDCGGIWRYMDMLQIISDPQQEEYEDITDWLGEDFDPKYFDL